jgi:hypothetical protein
MEYDMDTGNPVWNTFPFVNVFQISMDFELIKRL